MHFGLDLFLRQFLDNGLCECVINRMWRMLAGRSAAFNREVKLCAEHDKSTSQDTYLLTGPFPHSLTKPLVPMVESIPAPTMEARGGGAHCLCV